MIKSITYTAEQKGPRFLIIGAIHGNEKCGAVACYRVMDEIDRGALRLTCGQLVFVPVGNPRAFDLDRRLVERNLNRYLVPMEAPDCYEAQLGNILCPMLEQCDYHLAIHSYTAGGAPFLLISGPGGKEQEFAASLGPELVLTGIDKVYASRKAEKDEEGTGSIEYAQRHGAVAVTIECGQHKDPASIDIAYRAIRNALGYLGMVGEKLADQPAARPPRLISISHVYYRGEGGTLTKGWKHLEPVHKGETLAHDADGFAITAPENAFVIMPHADTPPGTEWFYLGVEKPAAV